MREVLFRGKSIETGEWAYGYLYVTHTGAHEISWYDPAFDIERMTTVVDPSTVGQWTGLVDKNGTKIFEGDVVSFRGRKCLVQWNDIYARYDLYCGENCVVGFNEPTSGYFEIIGNQWDNKDVLTDK